jgi:uncharacterized membrane protein
MRAGLILLVMLALSLVSVDAIDLKRDPETGIIRVIYVGMPFAASPYQVLKYDPLVSTLPVQGNMYGISASNVKRSMRMYMPRNQEIMTADYDVVGLDDTTYDAFPSQTIHWIAYGCIEDGLRLFMAGGFEAFGGGAGFGSWDNTVLREVLPVKCTNEYADDGENVILDIALQEDEFVRSVPWDEYEFHDIFGGYNVVELKQGANELSRVRRLGPVAGQWDPGWVWWDVGEGRFFASAPGFRGGSAGKQFIKWKHYPDFICNMIYFLAGLQPPTDINLLHMTRASFRDIYDQRQTVVNLLDFIAKFGADTGKVDLKLADAEDMTDEARDFFVDLELEQARATADEALKTLEDAYELAFEARDAALFWIFLTEWLVVTGTGLISGVVIWTLMIRRRLYREVEVTRGREV